MPFLSLRTPEMVGLSLRFAYILPSRWLGYGACRLLPSPPHGSRLGLVRVHVKKDGCLKLTSVHIFVVRRIEPCRLPGIRPVLPGREESHALAVGVAFLDNVGQDVVTSMAIQDDQ
jgi:hypothetical protein